MGHKTVKQIQAEALRLSRRLASHPGARKLLSGEVTREEYVAFLVQTYHYIRWSSPLLLAASRRLRAQGRYLNLAEFMELQGKQDDGHDQWVLSDLLALGCSENSIRATPPIGAVKAYVAWNFFMVEDGSAVALLGTAYVLALLSVEYSARIVAALLRANAIPGIQGAVKFLSRHAEVDQQNVELIRFAIRGVTDPDDCEAILDSAHTTRLQYSGLFAGLEGRGALLSSPLPLLLPRSWAAVLTRRQQQVVGGVLEGLQNKDIAADLGIKTDTVKQHLKTASDKLGVDSRTDLLSRYIWLMFDGWVGLVG